MERVLWAAAIGRGADGDAGGALRAAAGNGAEPAGPAGVATRFAAAGHGGARTPPLGAPAPARCAGPVCPRRRPHRRVSRSSAKTPIGLQTLERIAQSVVAIEIDSTARLRHRMEYLGAGDGLRGRCRPRPDPDQPPRGDSGAGDCGSHLPQPRRGAALSRVPRPGARLRPVSLRSQQAALHQTALRCRCSRKVHRSGAKYA